MVEYKQVTIWKCPYCHREYDSYEDALDCAEECVNMEYPTDDDKTLAICECCHKEFEDIDDAESCEEGHKRNNDRYYSDFRLKKASEHIEQLKLFEVKNVL